MNETSYSMRLSNIFNKDIKEDKDKNKKIKNLENKLLQLGEEPVEFRQGEYEIYEQNFLEKVNNISVYDILTNKPESKNANFISLERDGLGLLDDLFLKVYKDVLKTNKFDSSEIKNEKNNNKLEIYLNSNVPKEDLHPDDKNVCFLNKKNKFMKSYDSYLPLKIDKTVYDSFAMTVYIDRERTGFEDSKDFPIVLGSLIAGRYRVIEFLGAASFAKCVHVKDLKNNMHCCLKIIENNKDFIDQSIDEIKLLR